MDEKTVPVHEHRAPPLIAIIVILGIYIVIPKEVQALPNWVVPALAVLLIVPLVILNPTRLSKETAWSRGISITLVILLAAANQITVVFLIGQLLHGQVKGTDVLLTALQVWISTVIAFGLLYWELDRGGPVARRTPQLWAATTADFRFPQNDGPADTTAESTAESIVKTLMNTGAWRPKFLDYAYVALTNMMAFSPTDAMPMTVRAKLVMGYQAITGFVLLALVISRAVNILN
ncbi:hypothetical protein [Frigoribacterium sp. CG_9.8]|uniref:hypothetical protein n=1 Tax=Frigoribacterium sp. CG_9.8 TaxID=2787733 RepID=UPI001A19AE94|nr:hypothetical protein [Frigoribacterium sp. CG_9.8]MBG6108412.1 putative membrane protein [Frigoribacterium sp. CG_9.8]